jgi:hypothetical protein
MLLRSTGVYTRGIDRILCAPVSSVARRGRGGRTNESEGNDCGWRVSSSFQRVREDTHRLSSDQK